MYFLVGMSGGVDSSTVAALLKSQGHHVTGVTMSLWRDDNPYQGGPKDACYGPGEKADIEAARGVCAQLGIPFHVFDCAREYEHRVIDYFRDEYLAGRTPNPCVRCNAALKFGLLPELAKQAGLPFDAFATGHYARIRRTDDGHFQLLRAVDLSKDQSYFLCRLSQEQLARQQFPLGELHKDEVRELARKFGLAVAEKHDSQDFYSGEISELLQQPDREGDIVEEGTGRILGHHTGYWKYTIGQRKGLGVASTAPLYVVGIDPCHNRVTLGHAEAVRHHHLTAENFNWVSIEAPTAPLECQVKVRSVQTPVACSLEPLSDGCYTAHFPDGIYAVAPGQAAVFYQDDLLLGGGFIRDAAP
ncbi:MAG: tRNA 2-thiouridine(34) synthase MnmA [Victivallales bacterium]|nr:tRNA 2-thiouridine(34) synthase MnmA [Victivallales bacterium]